MRRLSVLLLLALLLTSCTNQMALSQVKEEVSCLEYHAGMDWDQVANKLGPPGILPKPEAGTDLSQNARGYNDMVVIFHTKREQVKEDGKIRFKEVVYKIEVCKKK
jgi:hypothetical protein